MIKELVFATHNDYKAAEVGKMLKGRYKLLNLNDIGCYEEIPETGVTFAENAAIKSGYVADHYQIDCFGDDSGLEIQALNNEPGIYSARYSGQRDDVANLQLVLEKMRGISNRAARFKTLICLTKGKQNYFFEGIINGKIRTEPAGNNGFGYDPIFEPEGYSITFAEMNMEQKNNISHRAIAMGKLIAFLKLQTM
jgi:XTP/dITP diphosphohydrolase